MTEEQLTIRLLGGVSLTKGERPITTLPTRKAEALLIYLVSHKRPFAREVLAELLWDDRPQDQALANLRSILSSLRRALKPYLLITRQTVGFNHDSNYWLDTAAFLHEIGDWRLEIGQSPDLAAAGPHLQSLINAAALYQGAFLQGFYLRESRGFEEWATLERERLQRQAILALRQLADAYQAAGQPELALLAVDRLLGLDPLSELAHQQKMLLLARSGQAQAALAHFQACAALLDAELGVAPAPETAALAQRIRASLSLPHHNLPPASTPFVGREAELAQVRQQLADPGCRLLTLLGPGGIGKTRLALAAAAGLAAAPPVRYLNGVRYVSLVPVDAPADLAAAIAAACGLTFQGSDPPLTQLIRHLADHEMLLLLDNFEHLIDDQGADGVDLLAALLAETPGVTYLVTSRERLNLQEEWVFDLAGLACPPADAADPDRYSAMQLFRQQAARLRRQFAPDTADLQAMAQVCRLLDGMPLGIELAAAWVRQYSCAEIARQVQADLDFLHTSLRNVPPRHRSLAAVFEHSWRLLSPAEQAVFARLSLFRGGFTAEAAAEVAEAPRDVLNGLVDKSLLRFGNGRYDLHELLQQYAAEKLAGGAADAAAVAQRHAAFYLRFAAQHDSSRNTAAQQAMAEAFANVRQAWQWAAQHGQAAVLAETAVSLHEFYSVQSRFQEGIDAYQFALDQLRALPETTPGLAVALCELWGRKARLHITLGQLEAAQQALDEAMVYLPAVENSERHSALLGYAAITTYYAGDYARAAALAVESMRLAEETGDQDGVAFGLNFLGSCAKVQGDYAAARDYFQRSADLYTALQDDLGAAMSVNNLGNVAQAAGDYATAQAHYLACSAVFKKHNHVHGAATTLSNAGKLAIRLGDYAQAEALLAESLALKRELQDTRGAAVALSGLGEVSLASGALDDARAHMLEALRLADEAGDTKLVLEVLGGLGALAARQGEDETAVRRLQFVLGHPATSQEVREQAEQVLARLRPSPAALQAAATWARQQSVQTLMRYRLEGES